MAPDELESTIFNEYFRRKCIVKEIGRCKHVAILE